MNKYSHIAVIVAWSLLIPAILVVLAFAGVNRNQQVCQGVEVQVTAPTGDPLITENEIMNLVVTKEKPLVGKKIASINLSAIESRIRKNPWVAEAAVFPTLTGKVCVKASPREAAIRIINRWGEQFYIDNTGVMFPTRAGFPSRVMVASGFINTRYNKGGNINATPDSVQRKSILPSVLYLNDYISHDDFLSALIGQIYINQGGDIELVPITANHTIVIGDTSNLERKFGKLVVFYDRVLKTRGWDIYKTVNLKFENQIVCSK